LGGFGEFDGVQVGLSNGLGHLGRRGGWTMSRRLRRLAARNERQAKPAEQKNRRALDHVHLPQSGAHYGESREPGTTGVLSSSTGLAFVGVPASAGLGPFGEDRLKPGLQQITAASGITSSY